MKKTGLSLILLSMFSIAIFAQLNGNPENWCRNGLFPNDVEDFSIGVVKAKKGERVYFFGDDENCPNGKNCKNKAYLLDGDKVIGSRKFGNWVCSWYQPKKGSETVGWINSKNLEFTPSIQGIEDFAGRWTFYDNEIVIKKTKDIKIFDIKGNAFWRGLGDNIHVGELDGKGIWNEKNLAYGEEDSSEYACKVKIYLVWNYLVISDNLNCGGVNVTFSGVYQRRSTR